MLDTTHLTSDDSRIGSVHALASASKAGLPKTALKTAHLTVPQRRLIRRASDESIFSGSDISELSFGSTEDDDAQDQGLARTLSNVSATLAILPGASKWRLTLNKLWVANYGALLVLLSQMFGASMNVATRILETPGSHGEPMHPFQILFVRQSITVFITTSYALWSKSVPHFPLGPPGKVRLLLVSRGLFGFLGVFGLYFSLLYLPISEAIILTFLAPIGASVAFSILLPGETFSRQQQIAGLVSIVGVVFIARPASLFQIGSSDIEIPGIDASFSGNMTLSHTDQNSTARPTSSEHLQAVGVALIGVVGAVFAMTSIRAIGQRAHALLSVNYFSAWCTFVSLVALVVLPSVKFRLPGNLLEWGLLSVLGFCGFVMQLLLTKGMAYGASTASRDKTVLEQGEDLEMQTTVTQRHSSASTDNRTTIPGGTTRRAADSSQIKGSGAKATSMLYTQMVFALISDKVVFNVTPDVWSWVGTAFILVGAIWVAAEGTQSSKDAKILQSTQQSVEYPLTATAANVDQEAVGLLTDIDATNIEDHIHEHGQQSVTSTGDRID